jgi:hypothetical protein
MNYEYVVDDENRIAFLSFRGHCKIRDLEHVLLALMERDDFNPEYDELTDTRECTMNFRPEEMVRFFHMFEEGFKGERGSTAILVDQPQETALVLVHQNRVNKSRNVRPFSSRRAALNWLNDIAIERNAK